MDYLFSASPSRHLLYDDGDIYWYDDELCGLTLFGRYDNYEVIITQIIIDTYQKIHIPDERILENIHRIGHKEVIKIIKKYILLKIIEKLS